MTCRIYPSEVAIVHSLTDSAYSDGSCLTGMHQLCNIFWQSKTESIRAYEMCWILVGIFYVIREVFECLFLRRSFWCHYFLTAEAKPQIVEV